MVSGEAPVYTEARCIPSGHLTALGHLSVSLFHPAQVHEKKL